MNIEQVFPIGAKLHHKRNFVHPEGWECEVMGYVEKEGEKYAVIEWDGHSNVRWVQWINIKGEAVTMAEHYPVFRIIKPNFYGKVVLDKSE